MFPAFVGSSSVTISVALTVLVLKQRNLALPSMGDGVPENDCVIVGEDEGRINQILEEGGQTLKNIAKRILGSPYSEILNNHLDTTLSHLT